MEVLYLKPGRFIGKKGLPKGRIECKKDDEPLKLDKKQLKVLEKNIPALKVKGVLLTKEQYDKFITVEDSESGKKKSDKQIALEKRATELGIEFNDSTKQKDLKSLIDAKEARNAIEKEATELEVDFTDSVADEDLINLINSKKEELEK